MRELDIHGGFGNRLFFLTGAPKLPIPMPAKPNLMHLRKVKEALHRLEAIPPVELSLSSEAQDLWNGFYLAWKQTQPQWDQLTGAAVKRIPAYILKLAMVYACFEQTVPIITKDQLEAAIQVGHYGARCAEHLMQLNRHHTNQGQCEKRVIQVLEHENLPPWKIHRQIGGRFTAEELNRATRALQTSGAILEVGKTTRHESIYGLRGRKPKV